MKPIWRLSFFLDALLHTSQLLSCSGVLKAQMYESFCTVSILFDLIEKAQRVHKHDTTYYTSYLRDSNGLLVRNTGFRLGKEIRLDCKLLMSADRMLEKSIE
jgi:hypothetical protein